MANEGFIKLYRKMRKWGWYDEPNTKAVFLHLLFLAQYEETFYRGIALEIGQAVATYDEIALENGLSKKQVRTAVEHLIETGEVALKRYPRFCVYTLINYDQYNGEGTQRALKGHSEGTQRALKGHSHMLRSKEIEEVEEIKNIDTPARADKYTPLRKLCFDYTEDAQLRGLLCDWLDVRKAKRAAATEAAIRMNLNRLAGMANESGLTVTEYMEEAIRRGWCAFYLIRERTEKQTGYDPTEQMRRILAKEDG